jgi:Zn-dependent protease with chaperone function
VDASADASAGFGGIAGIVFGGDLVLTIGLPLVAGLTVQQFAGDVAHELGHFSQGAAMRLTYVVRSINFWFARLVYERDDWDEALAEGCQRGDRLTPILLVALLCVWLSRRVLWVLMAVGHGLSCFVMRQMEYDADRFETRLVGTAAFVETARRLLLLGYGTDVAHALMLHAWFSGRGLPDDLAALIVGAASRLPPKKALAMDRKMQQVKTGLFDTHPAHGDRVRAARRENAPGVFHLEGSATQLFNNFAKTSRAASLDFYRVAFSRSVRRDMLVPATTFLSGENVQKGA